MPSTPLNELVALLGDLGVAATQSGSEADKNLKDVLGKLKEPMQAIVRAAGQGADTARQTLKASIVFEKGTELREFFQNVALSMIDAQKQLDIASIDYSNEAAVAKLPPARFAIPNVHAELRFGFSNLTNKGFSVFVFSNKEQKEQHSESAVSFDLVATAPQPREALLGGNPPAIVLGSRREAILTKLIEKIPEKLGSRERVRPQLEANRSMAIVLEYPGAVPVAFLVLWPGQPESSLAKPETWSFFTVAVLAGDVPTGSIFEKPSRLQSGVLVIPVDSDLEKMDSKTLQDLVVNVGDALMNVCMLLAGAPINPPSP